MVILQCSGWKNEVKVFILLIVLCIHSSRISGSGLGQCPRYHPMPGFNISRFTGQWFEVERSFYVMEVASSCTTLHFTLNIRRNLDIKAYSLNRWTENSSNISGTAIPMFRGSSIMRFKLSTKLPFSIARLLPGAGIYNILYTDYDNVAIIWKCSSFTMAFTDQFWILGRFREIPASTRIHIYDKIRTYNLDPERLIISKNENCTSEML